MANYSITVDTLNLTIEFDRLLYYSCELIICTPYTNASEAVSHSVLAGVAARAIGEAFVSLLRHTLVVPTYLLSDTAYAIQPIRRQTSSSDYSVDQGEPSSAQATNPACNWNAYPQMIQRWIEMRNIPSPYFGSVSSSSTLPSLPCTMEQAFAAFVFYMSREFNIVKDATEEIPDILQQETQMEENKVGIELFTVELAVTDQVANHAAEGLQERVTHLEAQLQEALFPKDIPLSDDEEEPFEEEPFEDEPLEEEPPEEEPVEFDDAQSYVSSDDEDV
ncbi:hypothetical protein L1987_83343 [Smallanthus sonchifolius]|uniref:Uncharacterized protein n=1 Tax=Smallanthus sonchifolius TaxID=185202 RepID=A0ACB8YBV2_9ASTR|nr:hypothetical protein L1987_83343 [Smallanthus sonchifolius]